VDVEPRPSWLPADAPWPPTTFTASPDVPLTTDAPLAAPAAGAVPWANVYSDVIAKTANSRYAYAGFWIRVVAYLIDSVIVTVPTVILFIVVLAGTGVTNFNDLPIATQTQYGRIFQLLSIAFNLGYFVTFWTMGSTPGMRIVGIRVADESTFDTIGIGKALLRYVGFVISGVCCGLGFLRVAWRADKQGLHDRLGGTVVIWR